MTCFFLDFLKDGLHFLEVGFIQKSFASVSTELARCDWSAWNNPTLQITGVLDMRVNYTGRFSECGVPLLISLLPDSFWPGMVVPVWDPLTRHIVWFSLVWFTLLLWHTNQCWLLMPNPFLYILSVLLQTIQFSQAVLFRTIQFNMNIVFVYTQLNVKTIQFSINTVSMSKTVLSKQFSLYTKTVLFQKT